MPTLRFPYPDVDMSLHISVHSSKEGPRVRFQGVYEGPVGTSTSEQKAQTRCLLQ
jgi:hypothetical protein